MGVGVAVGVPLGDAAGGDDGVPLPVGVFVPDWDAVGVVVTVADAVDPRDRVAVDVALDVGVDTALPVPLGVMDAVEVVVAVKLRLPAAPCRRRGGTGTAAAVVVSSSPPTREMTEAATPPLSCCCDDCGCCCCCGATTGLWRLTVGAGAAWRGGEWGGRKEMHTHMCHTHTDTVHQFVRNEWH